MSDAAPMREWRLLLATRNRLIHGYLGIDNDTLWGIVSTDAPQLLVALIALPATLPPQAASPDS